MSKKKILGPVSKCTGENDCVAVKRDGNSIEITSTIDAHPGTITSSLKEFVETQRIIRNSDDPLGDLMSGAAPHRIDAGADNLYTMSGPTGSQVLFDYNELTDFFVGVRDGLFDQELQLEPATV